MDKTFERRVLGRVSRRLIPFMFVLYIVAFLDRINVSFAALQMNQHLGFTDRVYGLGAGIFFIGYFIFEIPSNLILERVGARLWIARIMVSWGIVATGMAFVKSAHSFYFMRFLLGAAEAGFFPGMILYLTYWFPAAQRARAFALFLTATTIAGVLGAPISGWLLRWHGMAGLAGWQWIFIAEGLPSVILGVAVLFYLTDRPEQAAWLRPEERTWLSDLMVRERETQQQRHGRATLGHALVSGRVWLLSLIYFLLVITIYGFSLWLPEIVKGLSGLNDQMVGLVVAIPYLLAAIGMVVVGSHSDRTGERRWHVAGSALGGAACLVLAAAAGSPLLALVGLSLAAIGLWSSVGPFWSLPTSYLTGSAAAGGIALINSVGNLGGFAGPTVMGMVKSRTHSFSGGFLLLAGCLVLAAMLVLAIRADSARAEASPGAG
jgi:ACS family tartrate transporter-like MFS transporter